MSHLCLEPFVDKIVFGLGAVSLYEYHAMIRISDVRNSKHITTRADQTTHISHLSDPLH